MCIVIFSSPYDISNELYIVRTILETNVYAFHLRKPFSSLEHCRKYLYGIPKSLHKKIVLHQHHVLSEEYEVGLHYKSNIDRYTEGFSGLQTASLHDIRDIQHCYPYSYLCFSPVYQSISKKGYHPKYDTSVLASELQHKKNRILALGGIHLENIHKTFAMGFDGVALLGYIWENNDPIQALKNLINIYNL